ncbi:MAG TPA: phosphotransferase [Actinomycetes bacterium]|nr:phosphotransferase [Actinomycetes bacterium]
MDDADNGRRGLRARPGPELFRALREHWGLRAVPGGNDLGGSSSLNLLVGDGDRRYVARAHRPHVTPERLGAIQLARGALAAGGVPAAPPVPTRQGAPWAGVGGRLLEVEAWVDHDAVMDSWERLAAAMGLLARTHDLLGGVDAGEAGRRPRFANHLEPADMLARTGRGTARIRGWGPTAEQAGLADAADQLAERVAEAEAGLVPQLPRQLVHGDFWDDNVLFRHGRPVLLADFDFMGERARVDDLALTLRCAGSGLGAGAGPPETLARLARLAAGYGAALEVPLSAAERAALPLAMARQSLASLVGWVARLDDQAAARRHAAGAGSEVAASLRVMADLGRWQDAFS